jgi:hypothetical protein
MKAEIQPTNPQESIITNNNEGKERSSSCYLRFLMTWQAKCFACHTKQDWKFLKIEAVIFFNPRRCRIGQFRKKHLVSTVYYYIIILPCDSPRVYHRHSAFNIFFHLFWPQPPGSKSRACGAGKWLCRGFGRTSLIVMTPLRISLSVIMTPCTFNIGGLLIRHLCTFFLHLTFFLQETE